jgi:hypothetical protein
MSIGMTAISRLSRAPRRRTDGQLRSAVAALLILGSISCGGHSGKASGPAPESASGEIVLVVDNHHWNDVVISVLHDGVLDRVGLATAVKTTTFVLPSRRLGTSGIIRLRGHAVGAPDSHTTDSFPVQPGQEIQWTLESDLEHSSVAVH